MISSGLESASVYTDSRSLDKLKLMSRQVPEEAIRPVAKQFEALFIQSLLKSMRSSSLGDGIFDNDQTRLYQDLFDKQIAGNLSQGKGIGLADLLVRQLGATVEKNTSVSKTARLAEIPFNSHSSLNSASFSMPTTESITASVPAPVFNTPNEYLATLYPLAKDIERTHGIPSEVILAQSALETGWGKHIIKGNNGASSYNLFGIKSDERWNGDVVASRTLEFNHGIAESRVEKFRGYASFKDSMTDYAQFLETNPRYIDAMKLKADPQRFTQALQQAGYATDPEYANKINSIMMSTEFVTAIEGFKNEINGPIR